MFLIIKIRNIYISKKYYEDEHVGLLLIGEKSKKHDSFIKYFKSFMYCRTLCRVKKTFMSLLLTSFQYRRNIKMSC